jgi:hypothetical protein
MVVKITPPEARLSADRRSSRLSACIRRLPYQVAAHRERAKELIIQIVAVCDDHDRRIRQFIAAYELSRIESHQAGSCRTLRVPDHSYLIISLWSGSLTVFSTAWRTAWNW